MTWIQELQVTGSIAPHFVLTGNTRDYVIAGSGGAEPVRALPMVDMLCELSVRIGLEYLVVADPVAGFQLALFGDDTALVGRRLPSELSALPVYRAGRPSPERVEVAAADLARMIAVVSGTAVLGGLVVVDAGRWIVDVRTLSPEEHGLFTLAGSSARSAVPRSAGAGRSTYAPLWWLCRSDYELPAWYLADPCVRTVTVPFPDRGERHRLGEVLVEEQQVDDFADATDAMTTRELLAVSRRVDAGSGVVDAATLVRLGVVDDPWSDPCLVRRLGNGLSVLRDRVRGQDAALGAAWAAITRSLVGLSGIHRPSSGRRPRIVLFLAGATGVGKTELAKATAKLVFGTDRALIRFDMSGYTAEHSDQRLIGAPPGYVGYEAGGELTNAVRANPFSVLLFDEIEKAHPRILDKFLQILDEGHIDDGLGRRVYFDQAVVIFTSNIGIAEQVSRPDGTVRSVQNVDPSMPFAEVEPLVRAAVARHFVQRLGRPEILNRIGDNVVVFDFIRAAAASEIFGQLLENVRNGLRAARGVELALAPSAENALREACCADLSQGGRGISNKVESLLVNPLSVWLFNHIDEPISSLRITCWRDQGSPTMEIDHA